jgi:hypothetical protein
LGGAVLAGLGVDALQTQMTGPMPWRRFASRASGTCVLILAGLVAMGYGLVDRMESPMAEAARRVLSDRCFWYTLGGIAALLVLGCLPPSYRSPRRASCVIGLLALVELSWQAQAHLRIAPAEQFSGIDPVSETLLRLHKESPTAGILRVKARDSFFGDLAASNGGIEKTNIDDMFQLDHAARLYETFYRVASRPRRRREQPMDEAVDDYHSQVRQAVFDRMSVSYLVSDRVESNPGWPVVAQDPWQGAPFVIQRNPTALPRAYVVPAALVAPLSETATLSGLQVIDPRSRVVMNEDPLRVLPSGPRQQFRPAEWLSTDSDHPTLRVTTEAPGLLVVADTWLPGWTARVDGAATPVYRGNHAQRVVPLLQAGRHTIALHYQPPGFALGSRITAASVVCWILMCAMTSRELRTKPKKSR